MSIPSQGRPRAPFFRNALQLEKWLLALLLTLLATPQTMARAPYHENNCQIYDEQGACSVIVDFFPGSAQSYPWVLPPGYVPPGTPILANVVNMVYSYADRYGFKVSSMTMWVSESLSAYLFADQIDQLRDDPAVRLVTDNTYIGWPGLPDPVRPPFVAGEVTEYVNKIDFPKQPDGQYFYAAQNVDRQALDATPNWKRTGRSFKAAGAVSACRVYGGGKGGPNTHFYSLDKTDCDTLRALPWITYEGQRFAGTPATVAADGTRSCAAPLVPIYRLYNLAYDGTRKNDWESNHRYVVSRDEVNRAVSVGWYNEGIAFCQPQ